MLRQLPLHQATPSLDDLIAEAGDATEQPPLPPGGLPRQWVPGFIRWPLRILFLPFILLDLSAQWVARRLIRPPFRQEGTCLKRGNCCHYVLVPERKGISGKLYYLWNTQVLGFYPRSSEVYESEGKKVLVMGCRYLKKDGSCQHYFLRPTVCRKWPMIEYFGYPRILKGCGFRAVNRKID
jgi:Fe-S-cluster containining protein